MLVCLINHKREVFMKGFAKITLTVALAACLITPALAQTASAASPTGYTSAEDVRYVKSGKYIYNWGARGEEATFLSTYAEDFYTGSYVYSVLSEEAGGSGSSNAPKSDLYKALQTLMKSKQTHETSYDETRYQYCYTDCERGGGAISCFYTKKAIGPAWDAGKTWNREHTWPNSKGNASGNGENDIMMLRPTDSKTNSGRGNKAYGESGGTTFYDPDKHLTDGDSVRGDCARIVLYVYTRWGNTGSMWGASGVMESLPILLKWMEEDPVDTWEMGRNDAVQAITGTRNVFVDYPEYAWLLFGAELPDDMVTPSGEAKKSASDRPDDSSSSDIDSSVSSPDSSSSDSDSSVSSPDDSSSDIDSSKPSQSECEHVFGEWTITREPTDEKDGLRSHTCTICGLLEVEKIPRPSGDSSEPNWGNNLLLLLNCNATVVSPISLTVILACAYVLGRKKES